MSCPAPERELIAFRAADRLAPAEREAVDRHAATCADCRAELRDARAFVAEIESLHLSAEAVVAAAADGTSPPHLEDCASCRGEVELLRQVNADLRPSAIALPSRRRPSLVAALPWAAVLVLAVPAALHVRDRLRGGAPVYRSTPDTPYAASVDDVRELTSEASTEVPRGLALLIVPAPSPAVGERIEIALEVAGRRPQPIATDARVREARARIVVDTAALPAGPARIVVQRRGADGRVLETRDYALVVR